MTALSTVRRPRSPHHLSSPNPKEKIQHPLCFSFLRTKHVLVVWGKKENHLLWWICLKKENHILWWYCGNISSVFHMQEKRLSVERNVYKFSSTGWINPADECCKKRLEISSSGWIQCCSVLKRFRELVQHQWSINGHVIIQSGRIVP